MTVEAIFCVAVRKFYCKLDGAGVTVNSHNMQGHDCDVNTRTTSRLSRVVGEYGSVANESSLLHECMHGATLLGKEDGRR